MTHETKVNLFMSQQLTESTQRICLPNVDHEPTADHTGNENLKQNIKHDWSKTGKDINKVQASLR